MPRLAVVSLSRFLTAGSCVGGYVWAVEFAILGPLEVGSDNGPIRIPGAKQRAILSLLASQPGEPMSVDRLIDLVWGERLPANPKNALQSQMSELRRILGDGGPELIVTQPAGYLLAVEPAAVDAVRFEKMVEEGRSAVRDGDHRRGRDILGTAVGLWRGSPLPDVAGSWLADITITRLEELKLAALEDRMACDLALGRHTDVVPELEALVAERPTRERLSGQLMVALARGGRQADALEVFNRTREVLVDELGIDPGPELQETYEMILRQDDDFTPAPATPPEAIVPTPASLPKPFSSFVGRGDDLARVVDLIGAARLVTLTGPGGVGKTRLAVEAAAAAFDAGVAPDGVWLVELAGEQDPDMLWSRIADALGLSATGNLIPGAGHDGADRVVDAMRNRRGLLVMDNCEHLIEATAGVVGHLLSSTSDLSVVATSREVLGLPGEVVWSVGSLTVPPAELRYPGELMKWGAVELFVDRAQNADPGFTLDESSSGAVVDICRRLDGIPLALELAASRVRTLGVEELAARLGDSLGVLASGERTTQPRHRTMSGVVQWSWDLLDEAERALLRRMSVFAGPARIAAIEDVCSDPENLRREEVVRVLSGLVDKSVVVVERRERPVRYRLLEIIRSFAAEQLEASGEATEVGDHHTGHVLASTARLVPELRRSGQVEAIRHLDAQMDDVNAALRRLEAAGDMRQGGRLAADLGWYWYLRGHRAEGLKAMAMFASGAEPRDHALISLWTGFLSLGPAPSEASFAELDEAVSVLGSHGIPGDQTLGAALASVILGVWGDGERAARHLERARSISETTGEITDTALVGLLDGNTRLAVGDVTGARAHYESALRYFTQAGDRWGQVSCHTNIIECASALGDLTVARDHATTGIDLTSELGLVELEVILNCRLSELSVLTGSEDTAAEAVAAASRLAEEHGGEVLARNVDMAAGFLALRAGQLDQARQRYETVLDWLDETPFPSLRARTLTMLGTVAWHAGASDQSAVHFRQALEIAKATGDPRSIASVLEGLAGAYTASSRAQDAAMLLGSAEALRRSIGLPLPEVHRYDVEMAESAARAALGNSGFETAFELGTTTPVEDLPVI